MPLRSAAWTGSAAVRTRKHTAMTRFALLAFMPLIALNAQEYTRGIGVYPGDPKEDFAPVMRAGSAHIGIWHCIAPPGIRARTTTTSLRNSSPTASRRPTPPRWVATSTSQHGVLPRNEREWLLDGNWVSSVDLKGQSGGCRWRLGGGASRWRWTALRWMATFAPTMSLRTGP